MPVVGGAARSGPPPPAPSIYKKAIRFPSCDQRGRAAYPLRCVSFFGAEPSAFTVQSCLWSFFSPAVEKNVSVLESGDHDGWASFLSAVGQTAVVVSCASGRGPRLDFYFVVVCG